MPRNPSPCAHERIFTLFCTLLAVWIAGGAVAAKAADAPLRPLERTRPVELAPYMAELGRLFHKLALSIDADNPELARFYAYESKLQLERTQEEVPVYNGSPIAILIDRFALPPLAVLSDLLAETTTEHDRAALLKALDRALDRCNGCHAATDHGFLRVTRGTQVNPFNQDFRPRETENVGP